MKNSYSSGFSALTAVLLISIGTMVLSISAMASAIIYADSVERREIRIQNELNDQASRDVLLLERAKGYGVVD